MDPALFNQVFGTISQNANSGAAATGSVADWLIRGGLTAAAISQLLNGVATSADASPAMIDYIQNEMRYAQQQYAAPPASNTGLIVLLGLGALLLLNRE